MRIELSIMEQISKRKEGVRKDKANKTSFKAEDDLCSVRLTLIVSRATLIRHYRARVGFSKHYDAILSRN